MKKLVLILALFLSVNFIYAQNYDFENWTTDTVLTLDNYRSVADEYPDFDKIMLIKSQDSYKDQYSVRMETHEIKGDTIFGYFMNGDPESFTGGSPLSFSGVDSITGYYKYNIMPNDTALLACFTKNAGMPSGGNIFKITGSQNSWKRFSFYVGAPSADSVILAAASSNGIAEYGVPGSWFMLDNIKLKYNGTEDTVPNHSFENWTQNTWESPDNWYTANRYVSPTMFDTLPVTKTTDSYHGNFAAEIKTLYTMWGDTIISDISNAKWEDTAMVGGFPYTSKPDAVELHYKFLPAGNDTAHIWMEFQKNNNYVAGAWDNISQASNSYTLWHKDLVFSDDPDTLMISLIGGQNPGTKFVVDSINLITSVDVNDNFSVYEIEAFPNPAINNLNFKLELKEQKAVKLKITDLNGRAVMQRQFSKNKGEHIMRIDISTLSKGTYIYNLKIGDRLYNRKFIKH